MVDGEGRMEDLALLDALFRPHRRQVPLRPGRRRRWRPSERAAPLPRRFVRVIEEGSPRPEADAGGGRGGGRMSRARAPQRLRPHRPGAPDAIAFELDGAR